MRTTQRQHAANMRCCTFVQIYFATIVGMQTQSGQKRQAISPNRGPDDGQKRMKVGTY